jgi:hypothetical protein
MMFMLNLVAIIKAFMGLILVFKELIIVCLHWDNSTEFFDWHK